MGEEPVDVVPVDVVVVGVTGFVGTNDIDALAVFVGSATLVAITVTV